MRLIPLRIGAPSLPPVFREPGFGSFWVGIALATAGLRASATANLWQLQELTGSTLAVGLLGLLEGVIIISLSPLAGAVVDRAPRRLVLQGAQATIAVGSLGLAALSFAGLVEPTHIYVLGAAVFAAATFDVPARQSLVPAIVPRERLVDAYSLLVPALYLAWLLGPAVAGVLIAIWGAGAVYVLNLATGIYLIVALLQIHFRPTEPVIPQGLWSSVTEGFGYLKANPVLWQLIALDLTGTVFAAYRVLLPAIAQDVFAVGPAGYGILAAAPALGAVLGASAVYRLRSLSRRGRMAIGAAMGYGAAAILLGWVPDYALAVVSAAAIGCFASVGATIRHSALLGETPDRLRGRVASAYQVFSRGGTSLGEAQLGAVAAIVGIPIALGVGGATAVTLSVVILVTGSAVRAYGSSGSDRGTV